MEVYKKAGQLSRIWPLGFLAIPLSSSFGGPPPKLSPEPGITVSQAI
jgi:hypothetical protein